jgi:hypothetical protein
MGLYATLMLTNVLLETFALNVLIKLPIKIMEIGEGTMFFGIFVVLKKQHLTLNLLCGPLNIGGPQKHMGILRFWHVNGKNIVQKEVK